MKLVLTCEHSGNLIPKDYLSLFKGADEVLNSHRGFDPGAHDLFSFLRKLADYSIEHQVSRLLVEINRSLGNPQLFSEFTRSLSEDEKVCVLNTYYHPYRNEVDQRIQHFISKGEQVLHLSIHSFTPILKGETRNADIGLLYDPGRREEKLFSQFVKKQLLQESPGLKVRFNYPYLGKADGFTTFLRRKFPKNYLGIEVEVNQKFVIQDQFPSELKSSILKAVSDVKNFLPQRLKSE